MLRRCIPSPVGRGLKVRDLVRRAIFCARDSKFCVRTPFLAAHRARRGGVERRYRDFLEALAVPPETTAVTELITGPGDTTVSAGGRGPYPSMRTAPEANTGILWLQLQYMLTLEWPADLPRDERTVWIPLRL